MTDRTDLEAMTDEELAGIVADLGIKLHHNLGREKKIDGILAALTGTPEASPPADDPAPAPVAEDVPEPPKPAAKPDPVPALSPQQEAILKLTEPHRVRGMTVNFPDADSWMFKSGLKEDTGHIGLPINTIKRCADVVCKPMKMPSAKKS